MFTIVTSTPHNKIVKYLAINGTTYSWTSTRSSVFESLAAARVAVQTILKETYVLSDDRRHPGPLIAEATGVNYNGGRTSGIAYIYILGGKRHERYTVFAEIA